MVMFYQLKTSPKLILAGQMFKLAYRREQPMGLTRQKNLATILGMQLEKSAEIRITLIFFVPSQSHFIPMFSTAHLQICS